MIELKKISLIGNYPPEQCGIATFTNDLYASVSAQSPHSECSVVALTEACGGEQRPAEVSYEITRRDPESYERAAEHLNCADVSVVSLQHEFGIFGGASGAHVLGLLRRLRMPIVTTLHTVLQRPSPEQRRVLQEVCALSSRLVVMSERGRNLLSSSYGVSDRKVDLILHGIPDVPFVDPSFYKDQFELEGKRVLFTFGLLAPNKGVEHVIRALPEIVHRFPEVVYVVLGATHPKLVRDQGERYRESLVELAERLRVTEHVRFFNRFVGIEELKHFLVAADVYVTPYLNAEQITSGTLSYAFGCGKPVVSTPYWHARELLADGRGVLVPFADPEAISREICALLSDDPRRDALRKRAYLAGREMIWSRVAEKYQSTFEAARRSRVNRPLKAVPGARDSARERLPDLRIDHLRRLTDDVGMFQHAHYTFRNCAEGYCVDDNARALLFTLQCVPDRATIELFTLQAVYASFVDHAFNPRSARFRNFMSFDRRWLEDCGSADSQSRSLWALGSCARRSTQRALRAWSSELFLHALPATLTTDSPRAWSFTLLGIDEYLARFPGDRVAARTRSELAERLLALYRSVRAPGWCWPENVLSYDNARVAQALLVSGHGARNAAWRDAGVDCLRWLVAEQSAERGYFRPIGSDGFYPRGGTRARFDQQPIEAQATVSACASAFRITRDAFWYREAGRAFEWFLGANDLGVPLVDLATGGCHDGLHVDRVNLNQGAESTLAFLLSLVEMKQLDGQLATPVLAGDQNVPHAHNCRVR